MVYSPDNARHRGGRFELTLVYNLDLFSAERMEEFLAQYELLLEQVEEM